jgi:hypothetical protein
MLVAKTTHNSVANNSDQLGYTGTSTSVRWKSSPREVDHQVTSTRTANSAWQVVKTTVARARATGTATVGIAAKATLEHRLPAILQA